MLSRVECCVGGYGRERGHWCGSGSSDAGRDRCLAGCGLQPEHGFQPYGCPPLLVHLLRCPQCSVARNYIRQYGLDTVRRLALGGCGKEVATPWSPGAPTWCWNLVSCCVFVSSHYCAHTYALGRTQLRPNVASQVRLLRVSANRGKGHAVKRGMAAARGEFCLMMDADGATRFADLEKLEGEMEKIMQPSACGGGGCEYQPELHQTKGGGEREREPCSKVRVGEGMGGGGMGRRRDGEGRKGKGREGGVSHLAASDCKGRCCGIGLGLPGRAALCLAAGR